MEFSDHEEEEDMEIEEAPTNYNDHKPLLLQNHPLLIPRLNKNQSPVHSNRPLPPFNPNYCYFYKECLKNHALAVGGHALDGCGEFMPAGPDGSLDALRCAACNCHRNFHRKDIISYVWPRAPTTAGCLQVAAPQRRKRVRTKFTEEQKEKMLVMAEKLEWRIQKNDEAAVMEFCNEIGVKRRVLKVWMHNNKNTFRKESEQNKLSLDHHVVI